MLRTFLGLSIVLLWNTTADAQTVFYVNTDNSTSGDGTTNETDGSADSAYVSCSAFEAAEQADITAVSGGYEVRLNGSAADTAQCDFTGWTTDADSPIELVAVAGQGHNGLWDTNLYRLEVSSTFNGAIEIGSGAEYFIIDGLQIENTGSKASQSRAIYYTGSATTSSEIIIRNNIIRATWTGTPSAGAGEIDALGGINITVVNNFIYGNYSVGIRLTYASNAVDREVYSNTIYGQSNAIDGMNISGPSGTMRIFGNATCGSHSSADMTLFSTPTTGTNGTCDTSSPDGATYQSLSFSFTNTTAGSEDLRLTAATSQSGTDLSSDADYAFSDDIQGDTRSAWDLGADEYIAAGGVSDVVTLQNLSQSVGPHQSQRLGGHIEQ